MKILHILSQIPDATGSGIYLQAALRHAAKRGFENFLLAGVPEGADHHSQLELKADNFQAVRFGRDIPFSVVGMSDVMPYPSTRFSDLSDHQLRVYLHHFEDKLVKAVERWQPNLIHSHHLWLLTSLAKQRYPRVPMITSCHGSDLRQFHNCRHLQPLVLAGCQMVDSVCALSHIQKLEIEQLYGIKSERIQVVGAGFDCERFFWPKDRRSNNPLEILYAGKLSRAKGIPWLLKTLLRLPREQFIFHLVGDGDGTDKAEILKLAHELGSSIRIHGKLEQMKLANLMRQSDIFVLPSFYEGLPLVLLEALACGNRIVTTALPGISELFAMIQSDWIELIDLPQMISIDEPHPADEEHFIAVLARALKKQFAQLAHSEPEQHCPATIDSLLKQYTWEGIFRKIEQRYLTLSV